jgi:tRNA (guanine37-N1)-methyltransferase
LKVFLANKLESQQLKQLYKSYDIVGNIAIIRIPETLRHHSELVARAIMDTHGEIISVWRQTSPVSGDYRLRNLEFILGKKTSETSYKEHGCIYKTDLRKVYFSPRLSFERLRIAKLVKTGEVVLNMFAGVGCYSIAIAVHSNPTKVYSIDVNPIAFNYLQENIRLNKAEKTIVPLQGDAKTIIKNKFQNVADRVLMPLPEKAYDYLDYAILALKSKGGHIHYYDFGYTKKKADLIKKIKTKISEKMLVLCKDFHVEFSRIVRSIGPRWYQIVLDLHVRF